MRLHLCCAPNGTPRASILAPADQPEREVALRLLPQALRGGEQIVCDKGYTGREFAAEVEARFAAEILRPNRKDEPEGSVRLSTIRWRRGARCRLGFGLVLATRPHRRCAQGGGVPSKSAPAYPSSLRTAMGPLAVDPLKQPQADLPLAFIGRGQRHRSGVPSGAIRVCRRKPQ